MEHPQRPGWAARLHQRPAIQRRGPLETPIRGPEGKGGGSSSLGTGPSPVCRVPGQYCLTWNEQGQMGSSGRELGPPLRPAQRPQGGARADSERATAASVIYSGENSRKPGFLRFSTVFGLSELLLLALEPIVLSFSSRPFLQFDWFLFPLLRKSLTENCKSPINSEHGPLSLPWFLTSPLFPDTRSHKGQVQLLLP